MNLMVLAVFVAVVLLLALAFRPKPPPPTSVEPSVIQAFRKIYRQQWLMAVPTAAFLVWLLKDPSRGGVLHGLLLPVAAALVAWVCVSTYRHWRCPKCGAYLGRNSLYTGQCPNCGTALREPRGS